MLPDMGVIDRITIIIFALIIILILLVTKTEARVDLGAYPGQSFIWVSIYENRSHGVLYYINADGHIEYTTPISSGASGFDTPNGNYKIYYKKRYHMSSKYPDASGINNMDYSLFFLGGFALHQGNPRQKSHGCVHVGPGTASVLFKGVRHGTPVVITRVAIKHKKKKKKRRMFQSKLDYLLKDF